MGNTVGHFINGELVHEDGRVKDVFDPSTGLVSKQVALASINEVQRAIEKASDAYAGWRSTPPLKRARIMFRYKELLEKNSDAICALIGEEHGKIKHDAYGELQRGIENVEYACAAPDLLKGEHTRNVGTNVDAWSEFQPLGVVAGITPFNFPAMVPLWMFPLAIACGNTFVLKPSERDPSTTLFIAQLLADAGLPEGVMNVVNGDKEAVDAILEDPRVKAVSFVGSTPVAEYIYSTATRHGKRCQALGGAKNHAILMPDADVDNAVNQLVGAAFGSSGERCMALSVVVAVGDQVADALVSKMTDAMGGLKVGCSTDNSNDLGPLITDQHKSSVVAHISSCEQQGATVVVDGRQVKVEGYEDGFFVAPTLIDHVAPDMDSYRAEIFGPVLQIIRVDSLQDAIDLVNDHEYGNGSCIFTRDGESARYFSDCIQVGMVGINVPLPVPVAYHSFGGWKRSLFGDLRMYGPDGVRFYTQRKTITQRWPSSGVREGVSMSFPS